MKMGHHTLKMLFTAILGVMVKTVLNGSTDDGGGIYESVCLCHNATINGSRGMAG